MRQGRARPDGDDAREAGTGPAGPADVHLHRVTQLALGRVGVEHRPEHGVGPLGDGDGLANLADLVVVLDRPHGFDQPARRRPVEGGGQFAEALVQGDGDVRRLEADLAGAEAGQDLGGFGHGGRGRRAEVDGQAGALLGKLFGEAAVADEQLPLAADDEVAGITGEAGEVGDVDGVGDEQGVEAEGLELAGEALAAGGVGHCVRSGSPRTDVRGC